MKPRVGRILGVAASFLAIAAFIGGSTHFALQAQSGGSADGQNYSDEIRKSFNFLFAKDDFSLPGNAATVGNQFIQPGAFPPAEYCGHCHEEAYHQWRQALHSNSFRTPFYRASVNILIRNKGIEYSRHCDSCHNPIAVVSGALTKDAQVDRSFDQDGLTCTTCHSIQQLQSTAGNGGYVMGVPAVMVDENGKRIPGEVPFGDIIEHPERHSQAVMQPFYRTPEFCAACHKANLPSPLNDYKFIRAFTTYDEWQNSKFSQRNPLTFYSADFVRCQDCHMHRARHRSSRLWRQGRYVRVASLDSRKYRCAFLLRLRRATSEDDRVPEIRQVPQRGHFRAEERTTMIS